MINRVAVIIAPNWHDYAEKYLQGCIDSVRAQKTSATFKVFLTDNESTPESVALLKRIAPEVEITTNKTNDGFAKGNNDSIKKALAEGFEYLVLLNMDTEVEPDFLEKLLQAAATAENWGAIQSRIMLYPEKDKINSLGNSLHYLGFGFSAGGYQDIGVFKELPFREIKGYFSGSSVLLRKDVLEKTGLFDENFWMYHDDLDLSWKITLAGYKVYLAPRSVIYHKYQFVKSIKQYFWMERNRFIFLFTDFHPVTLILIAPMLLAMELGLFLFAIKGGFWKEKLRVYAWFLKGQSWDYLRERRWRINNLRKVKDKDLVKYLSSEIQFQEINNPLLKYIGNPVMKIYWQIVKRLIVW
ncbi:MAG: glycosyltransferase family 2 protein [Patescibacteria group bacterium]